MAARPNRKHQLAGVPWGRVFLAGIVAPLLAVAVWVALVFLYGALLAALAHGVWDGVRVRRFGEQGAWAVPSLTLALTAIAGSWVARRAGAPVTLHGSLVGSVAAVVGLIAWTLYHGTPGPWAAVACALTIGAGWLGGLEAQSVVAGQEALGRASRAIAAARGPEAIVRTIGEYLGDGRVSRVALWQVVARAGDGQPTEIALLASWALGAIAPWPAGVQLRAAQLPALSALRRDLPTVFRADGTPPGERATWERLAVRAAILLPLIAPDDTPIGLLMLVTPAAGDGAGGASGAYLALGAQVALALENLRLVEQGRQIGAMAERQRLAREIHDSVKQQVFAAGMQIAAARALLERNPPAARERLAQADSLVRGAQDELAAVIHELRPATLEGKGLTATLRDYVAGWSRQADLPAEVRARGERTASLATEQALYRVAQEALANVAKHSRATAATVELEWEGERLTLRVSDDGCGFAPETVNGVGYGLASMGERVAALGGRVTIESAPGRGTRIVCTLPLTKDADGRGGALWASR